MAREVVLRQLESSRKREISDCGKQPRTSSSLPFHKFVVLRLITNLKPKTES